MWYRGCSPGFKTRYLNSSSDNKCCSYRKHWLWDSLNLQTRVISDTLAIQVTILLIIFGRPGNDIARLSEQAVRQPQLRKSWRVSVCQNFIFERSVWSRTRFYQTNNTMLQYLCQPLRQVTIFLFSGAMPSVFHTMLGHTRPLPLGYIIQATWAPFY